MINYVEKGSRLHDAIADSGYTLTQVDGVWISSDDTAVQAIIDSFNQLPHAKKAKRKELKTEHRTRTMEVYTDAGDIPEEIFEVIIDMCFDVFRSVIGPSRSPNNDWQAVLDIRTAKKNARSTINGFTTVAEVEAYDVVNDPAWPA